MLLKSLGSGTIPVRMQTTFGKGDNLLQNLCSKIRERAARKSLLLGLVQYRLPKKWFNS